MRSFSIAAPSGSMAICILRAGGSPLLCSAEADKRLSGAS
jgi:hypothetical protein